MSSHKNREHLETIRENIAASSELNDAEKNEGVKMIEERNNFV